LRGLERPATLPHFMNHDFFFFSETTFQVPPNRLHVPLNGRKSTAAKENFHPLHLTVPAYGNTHLSQNTYLFQIARTYSSWGHNRDRSVGINRNKVMTNSGPLCLLQTTDNSHTHATLTILYDLNSLPRLYPLSTTVNLCYSVVYTTHLTCNHVHNSRTPEDGEKDAIFRFKGVTTKFTTAETYACHGEHVSRTG